MLWSVSFISDSVSQKIKCDETHPHCSQCTRKGYECPGYKRPLKWSSKHEVASGNEARWKSSQTPTHSRTTTDRANLCASRKEASIGDVVIGSLHWPDLDVPLLLPLSEDQDTSLSRPSTWLELVRWGSSSLYSKDYMIQAPKRKFKTHCNGACLKRLAKLRKQSCITRFQPKTE